MKKIAKGLLVASLLTGLPLVGGLQTDAAPAPVAVQKVENQKVLQQSIELAKIGRVINSEQFGIGSKKRDIEKKWGKGKSSTTKNSTNLLEYKKRGVIFAIDLGKVTDVETKDQRVLGLTYKEVRKALGKPVQDYRQDNTISQAYKAGKNYIEVGWTTNKGITKMSYWNVTANYYKN